MKNLNMIMVTLMVICGFAALTYMSIYSPRVSTPDFCPAQTVNVSTNVDTGVNTDTKTGVNTDVNTDTDAGVNADVNADAQADINLTHTGRLLMATGTMDGKPFRAYDDPYKGISIVYLEPKFPDLVVCNKCDQLVGHNYCGQKSVCYCGK